MIVSHSHKFIFIKTNKTAGTSVEIALSKFCGENDILTPISPEDEKTRIESGYRTAQNYELENGFCFFNHISGTNIKRVLGRKIWDSYFKFCIERNPWDRVISMYYWKCRSEPRPPLIDFLRSENIDLLKARGSGLYMINGSIAVDRICRFESLEDDLAEVAEKIGLNERLHLPRAKSQFRIDRRPYRNVYSEKEQEIVAKRFAFEIELLGYQY